MSHHDTLTSRVLLSGADSGEEIGIVEITLPPAWDGPPLHHHDFDEAFYVLDGELTLQLGDDVTSVAAGSLTFAPRGSHHTIANLGAAPARYLLVCAPGGFERMFLRLEAERAGLEPPPEARAPWPETVVVGPTLFERTGRAS
jgi:quercetin dioxygenase-like cupin family protein